MALFVIGVSNFYVLLTEFQNNEKRINVCGIVFSCQFRHTSSPWLVLGECSQVLFSMCDFLYNQPQLLCGDERSPHDERDVRKGSSSL